MIKSQLGVIFTSFESKFFSKWVFKHRIIYIANKEACERRKMRFLDLVNLFSHLVRVGTYANYGQISCFNFSSIFSPYQPGRRRQLGLIGIFNVKILSTKFSTLNQILINGDRVLETLCLGKTTNFKFNFLTCFAELVARFWFQIFNVGFVWKTRKSENIGNRDRDSKLRKKS